MKRFLLLLLVLLLLPMTSAYAESGADFDPESGVVTIMQDGLFAQSNYAVIIMKDGAGPDEILDPDKLLYINQFSASEDGTLELVFINPGFPPCEIYLGGFFPDEDSPLKIGSIGTLGTPSELPAALTDIEAEAFAGSAFTYVIVGEGTRSIGDRAFENCRDLLRIVIPDSVTEFGTDVFNGCDQLSISCNPGSAAYDYALTNGIPVVGN